MKTRILILLLYIAVFLMGMLSGMSVVQGYDATDIDVLSIEKAYFLQEHGLAYKELTYAIERGEDRYKQRRQVLKRIFDCYYGDMCNFYYY